MALQVLDTEPVLDAGLIKLGQWISQYYLAPIGDVFRSMLPLAAEIKKARIYRMTETGYEALHASANIGSSRRSKQDIDTQMVEYAVLDYLSMSEDALEGTIRSATGANRQVLDLLLRKKWIAREGCVFSPRRGSALCRWQRSKSLLLVKLFLKSLSENCPVKPGKLNENQQRIITFLQQQAGRALVEQLRTLDVPRTTLQTLVKREMVELIEEPAEFVVSSMKKRGPSHLDFIFNAEAKRRRAGYDSTVRGGAEILGFIAAWRNRLGQRRRCIWRQCNRCWSQRRSAILLVPEIGLTPAAAANLHQVFGR